MFVVSIVVDMDLQRGVGCKSASMRTTKGGYMYEKFH